jgi:hypothetical protein
VVLLEVVLRPLMRETKVALELSMKPLPQLLVVVV